MFKNERFYIGLLAAIQFSHIVDFVVLMPLGPVLMRYFSITPIQFGSLVSSYKNELGGLSGKPIFVDSTIILKKM